MMTMHDDQLTLDEHTVRLLVRDQFPQWGSLPVRRVSTTGTVNAIYRIGDQLAARFPLVAGSDARAAADRETAAMAELARSIPFSAPEPRGIGDPGHGYPCPWTVQTWIPGRPATPTSHQSDDRFARDLVDLIGALRSVPTAGRAFDGDGRGGELIDSDPWVQTCLERSSGILPVDRLARLWARLRVLPLEAAPVMSHRDLIPANLLVVDGAIVGVLDGGGFGPSDPALDLVAAWHLLDTSRRAEVRRALGCGDLEWGRGAAWAFQQAIGLVWYYRTSNPTMSELGRSSLERLLEDPVDV